jgi:hypothetical protein
MILKNKTNKYAILTLMVLAGLVSCERELGVLAPAPFPTDAEVFIDGFGPSIEPKSFSGTKLDALQTDDTDTYDGSSSIVITIPGPGDPSGSTWSGGALVAGAARDLSGYNALTFYAKANKALTLNTVGFGNDNEAPNPYVAEIANLPITTSWMQYTIPIPLAEKLVQEQGMFYYSEGQEDGEGATIWLDEIQFESLGTIAHPSFSFASDELSVYQNAIISIPSITVSFDVGGSNVDVSASSEYLTFSSSDTSIIGVDTDGTLTAKNLGDATVYAYLGENSVSDSLVISVGEAPPEPATAAPTPTVAADSVVSIYSNVYTSVTTPDFYTYWEFSTAAIQEVSLDGNDAMQFLNLNFAGIDFSSSDLVDASAMTTFHMDVWTPDPSASPAAFKILLVDFGPDGDYGGSDNSSHELSITASSTPALVSDEWMSLDIPISSFTGLTSQHNIAQLVISGDPNTVYLDNIYFWDNGDVPPPPVGGGPSSAAPTPTAHADSVISLYSDAYTDVAVDTWATGWEFSTTVFEEVQVENDDVILYTELNFNGIEFTTTPVDASEMTRFHMDIWTPDPTASPADFKIKLVDFGANGVYDGGDDSEHELTFTSSSTPALATESWVSLDVAIDDFSGLTSKSNLAQMIISGSDGLDSIYVDNVYFYIGAGGGGTATTSGPAAPATTPTVASEDVISLFSNAYTDVTVDNWATGWQWSTAVLEEVQVAGDDIKLYTALNFNGIEFTSEQLDVSEMTHFHMDIWTPDPTASPATYSVKLIDFGANGSYDGGDDSEHELMFTSNSNPAIETGAWVNIDVSMTAFSGLTGREHLAQMVISASEGLDSVYVDNVYFYKESGGSGTATEPEAPATAPTVAAADVISLFSNAYTDVTVDNWATGWQWSTAVLEDVQVAGDDVKLYTLLNFNGIEFTTQTIDASAMTHFHVDIWTPDPTGAPATFNVKLIDFGANGSYDGGDDSEHELIFTSSSSPAIATGEWVSIEVQLTDFSGLTARSHIAQMVISASDGLNTVYMDNVYFHK